MSAGIVTLALQQERDVVLARQRARQIAGLLGFDAQDQTRLATAVSEIARNTCTYARNGKMEVSVEGASKPQILAITVSDDGPGIASLADVLEGRYRSSTGMGVGILGAKRLMDRFDVRSTPAGTTVVLKKFLPPRTRLLDAAGVARVAGELARLAPLDPYDELQRQNHELLHALEELGKRQEDLNALNRELEDTNRGVVALYAELDEKADHLRRADELKSRFLSNMSHEFRTPVNSIQALARLLLDRIDGELSLEQERQVTFIRKAAFELGELVNDLLDLAKVEAGKTVVRPSEFDVSHLFGTLRGMLRPLLANDAVALVFEEPGELPPLCTDEAKVSQILRNFVSNALKFTEAGEVRVSARLADDGEAIEFAVRDTGIGIAAADQESIFQDFTQIDSPLQRRVKGTGLGLPLCRKLADLLGGGVAVASEPGVGSTFTARIARLYRGGAPLPAWEVDPSRFPVLVVEGFGDTRATYEKLFAGSIFQMIGVRDREEAREALATFRPAAIVLDLRLADEEAWTFLPELKRHPATRNLPIAIVGREEDIARATALGADAACAEPLERLALLHALTRLVQPEKLKRILIVDDEEVYRYLLRQHLSTPEHILLEAVSGAEALAKARTERPDVICLDLLMPDLDGFEVLRRLKAEAETESIPVIIASSQPLDESVRRGRLAAATGFLPKDAYTRDDAIAAIQQAMRKREVT